MDTQRCAALVRALELGSLSAAAEELGYTPSGMSRAVAALEDELGFVLLYRSKKGIRPTPECERLLPLLRELAALGQTCEQSAAQIRGAQVGVVRVGSAYRQFFGELARILAGFGRERPGVRVEIAQGDSSPLVERLEARELDLCIVSRREGELGWTPLLEDELVALVPVDGLVGRGASAEAGTPNGDGGNDAGAYPLARFAADPFIEILPGQVSDNSLAFEGAGVHPNVRFAVSDVGAALELVSAGLGVTLVNSLLVREAHEGVRAIPIEPAERVEIGIATPASSALSPAARAFCDTAIPKLVAYARGLGARSCPPSQGRIARD